MMPLVRQNFPNKLQMPTGQHRQVSKSLLMLVVLILIDKDKINWLQQVALLSKLTIVNMLQCKRDLLSMLIILAIQHQDIRMVHQRNRVRKLLNSRELTGLVEETMLVVKLIIVQVSMK